MIGMIQNYWCKLFHRSIGWPIMGAYPCWTCGRKVKVNF